MPTRSIICRRNDLPGLTTRQACCNVPMRDSSSRFVHDFLCHHCPRSAQMRESFSWGRRRTPALVSISMPKNVRCVEGPSSFSRASGTPNSSHVRHISYSACAHSSEPAGLNVTKSSSSGQCAALRVPSRSIPARRPQSPNGSIPSTYLCPCHWKPNSGRSTG